VLPVLVVLLLATRAVAVGVALGADEVFLAAGAGVVLAATAAGLAAVLGEAALPDDFGAPLGAGEDFLGGMFW